MMRDSWQEQEEGKSTFFLFAMCLLFVFAVELFIMDLFSPLFASTNWVVGSLVDAVIMTVLCAGPLWFLLVRLPPHVGSAHPSRRPLILMVQGLCGIFLTELVVMLLVPAFFPGADLRLVNFADAILTSVVSAIPLWWLLFGSRNNEEAATVARVLDTPLRLFALLLGAVFLVDLLQEVVFPRPALEAPTAFDLIGDSCITALLTAPLLFMVVARPLKRAARSGRVRAIALYAQVVDAVVVLDRSGALTSCNPAAERVFGYKSKEMRGRSAAILLQDGEPGLVQLLAGAAGLQEGSAPLSSEIICRCKDGSTPVMEVSLSEVHLERRREYLLIMRDITERKRIEGALRESEARFRQIFEQSADAIVFFRFGSCEILDANSQAERVFGYRREELCAVGLEAICPGENSSLLCREISGIEEGKPLKRDKLPGRRKDGAEILLSLRAKVMVLHGLPVTFCSFRDITERVRMEEREHLMQTKLIQANKMTSLGLLVSGVAHEINNPNNYVTVSARLFERVWQDALALVREYREENGDFCLGGIPCAELEPRCRELLEGIIDGSRRIDEIIGNLKRFARQEVATPEEVDLNAVARSAVSLMHHEMIRFTDRFQMELSSESEPVLGSRQQLGQVVINLLMNACQALPERTRGIRLSTELDREAGEMRLTVSDEGCGMTEVTSRRILEPFFTTKRGEGGTGLGLAICDSIVKEHHGTLSFVSAPGEGTTVTVTIPVGAPPAQGAC